MPPRILVVDDNAVNLKLSKCLLDSGGYEVVLANNGREGVEMVMQQEFDAVLMDIQMPVMDGITATRAIRQWEQQQSPPRHVPILAVTAYAIQWNREQCMSAGMDDFLTKPVTRKSMLDAVAQWIQRGQSLS